MPMWIVGIGLVVGVAEYFVERSVGIVLDAGDQTAGDPVTTHAHRADRRIAVDGNWRRERIVAGQDQSLLDAPADDQLADGQVGGCARRRLAACGDQDGGPIRRRAVPGIANETPKDSDAANVEDRADRAAIGQ